MKTPNRHAMDVILAGIGITAVALVGLVIAGCALVRMIEGGSSLSDQVRQPFVLLSWRCSMIVAAFCGLVRVSSFHPNSQLKYKEWLKTTPWHSGKTLPLGPVHLLPAEWGLLALWVGMLALVAGRIPLHLPAVFLTSYLVAMTIALFNTDEEAIATTLLFGLGGVARFWSYPVPCLILVLAMYGLAYVGLRRSLLRFPWPQSETTRLSDYGWPLRQLGPKRKEVEIGFSNAVMVSLLVAWWGHVLLYGLSDLTLEPPDSILMLQLMGFAAIAGLLIGLARFIIYSGGYASPISLWGRIRTGRLIIPSHDSVWVAPLFLPGLGVLSMAVCNRLQLSPLYSLPAVFSYLLVVAMLMPPSRRQWQLTGEHRLIPAPVRPTNNPRT